MVQVLNDDVGSMCGVEQSELSKQSKQHKQLLVNSCNKVNIFIPFHDWDQPRNYALEIQHWFRILKSWPLRHQKAQIQ